MKSSVGSSCWPGSPGLDLGIFPLKQITRLASKRAAQFLQNISTVHPGAIVVQPEQCRIANTRFLPQAVKGPSLLFEDFSEPANNHGSNLAGPEPLCQATYTCIVSFTQQDYGSKLAAALKGNSEAAVKLSGEKRHAS
jgi:hypothetical protein